ERADQAGNTVDAEYVQRIVIAQFGFQTSYRPEADDAGNKTQDDRAHWTNETASRSDSYQAGNCTRCAAQHGWFTFCQPFDKYPAQYSCAGCNLSIYQGKAGNAVSSQFAAYVEAEPTYPQ